MGRTTLPAPSNKNKNLSEKEMNIVIKLSDNVLDRYNGILTKFSNAESKEAESVFYKEALDFLSEHGVDVQNNYELFEVLVQATERAVFLVRLEKDKKDQ